MKCILARLFGKRQRMTLDQILDTNLRAGRLVVGW